MCRNESRILLRLNSIITENIKSSRWSDLFANIPEDVKLWFNIGLHGKINLLSAAWCLGRAKNCYFTACSVHKNCWVYHTIRIVKLKWSQGRHHTRMYNACGNIEITNNIRFMQNISAWKSAIAKPKDVSKTKFKVLNRIDYTHI